MTPARIMIVEDERITAEDLRDILTGAGYSVTAVVSTAAEAIRLAESSSPDIVLMDIRIQGAVDGVEAARTLRGRFDIPVIYLTAHADEDTLSRARLAEPLGYLVKPFQEAELHATIEMALHKQKADRESKHREAQLDATLSAIGEAIVTVDAGCRITYLNPAAEAWTGVARSDAIGQTVDEVLRLRESPGGAAASAPLHRALRQGALTGFDESTMLVSADGAEQPVDGNVSPIRDSAGAVNGAVIVFGRADRQAPAEATATPSPGGFEMVVESPAMKQVVHFARRVAQSEVSAILIEGESGTGKDIVAKYLHYHSRRQSEPFLAINCAAIPETLLESELFGYEKGAFTDARAQKRGILELATGGTVFLDEIAEMPLALQAKLLRVLEDQTFRRLGGLKDIQVDLRLITATNRDLREALQQGRFRLDLYYRLNVIQIVIPPLRERKEDILPLANFFLGTYNERFRRHIAGISPQAAELLLTHPWPGNVREVRNTIERAMVLEESSWIQPANLGIQLVPAMASSAAPLPGPPAPAGPPPLQGLSLEDAEKAMLLHALEKAAWNQTRAAKLLSVTRDTLRYKMKKYDLKPTT